jgi:hypothetical protein
MCRDSDDWGGPIPNLTTDQKKARCCERRPYKRADKTSDAQKQI